MFFQWLFFWLFNFFFLFFFLFASAWDREKYWNYTVNNIFPDDTDVVVTVSAGLFMVKAQSVK